MRKLTLLSFVLPILMTLGYTRCASTSPADKKAQDTHPDMEELRQINAMIFTRKIDSCDFITVPYVGATKGFDLYHSPVCPNTKHHTGK